MSKETDLIESILRYVVPTVKKHKNQISKKDSDLEEILRTKKQEAKNVIDDLVKSILKNNKNVKVTETIEEEVVHSKKSVSVEYGKTFERKKEGESNFGYKVTIEYEETEIEEAIKVTVSLDDYKTTPGQIKDNKKEALKANQYSVSIKREKEELTPENYKVSVVYENNYEEERLSINYNQQIGSYLGERERQLNDFTDKVPGKWVDVLPPSIMGGILGFTYLGQDRMALRDDLIGDKEMVDIHESIHTPDEYETRVLTDWIMAKPQQKYIK